MAQTTTHTHHHKPQPPCQQQAPLLFHATPAMPVATAHGLMGWLALLLLGLTALEYVRRRAFDLFKARA